MRKLACVCAVLGALVAIGSETPALAATGQCFDAYGRPAGPPHNTDNPPYGLICSVYRQGGHCTGVQPSWAQHNCGLGPRYHGYRGSPSRHYDYGPRGDYDRRYYRQRKEQQYDPYPHRNVPGLGSCVFPDPARCYEHQNAPR